MTDLPVERADLRPGIYTPFPAFADFAQADVEFTTVDRFVAVLDGVKSDAAPAQLEEAVRRATRRAAVDTGALENLYEVNRGFTFTVAAEAAAWDSMHLTVGDEAKQSIEDAMSAYDMVLDAVTSATTVTETWIRQLHEIICASQETYTVLTAAGKQQHALPRGAYKDQPNNPFNLRAQALHAYAPVDDTAPEMQRLTKELASDAFEASHPVLQAAYAHYAFVCIHPFADGNGRVARALASVYLYRSPGVPLMIFADQKAEYLDALEAADAGNSTPFVNFLANCAIDVVRMVATEMRRRPRSDSRERDFNEALTGRGGLPHEEIDALAGRILKEWQVALQNAVLAHPLAPPLSAATRVGLPFNEVLLPDGYRHPPEARHASLVVTSAAPAAAQSTRHYGIVIARGEAALEDFLISTRGAVLADVLLRDVHPSVSHSLRHRLDVLADEELNQLVDEVTTAAETTLRDAGYLG